MEWRVRLVDYDGVGVAELENAKVTRFPAHRLNDIPSAAFTLPIDDPKGVYCWLGTSRVQFIVDGTIWWVGEIVRPLARSDTSEVEFQCRFVNWPLSRRFVGKADRTNLAVDPEMELETGWTAAASGGDTVPTDTYETSTRVLGVQSLKLVSAAFGENAYATQTVSWTAGIIDDFITVAGWFYVDPTGYLGPAFENRGLYIFQDQGGASPDPGIFEIDDTHVGSWQRAETGVFVPAGTTADVEIRLYSPGGSIYWDAVSVTLMESGSYTDTDQASIIVQLVAHAQDTDYQKSNLNIGTDCPSTGVLRSRYYQHAEHAPIWDSIVEFTELENGVDVGMEWDADGTDVRLVSYYPSKGTARPLLKLECDANGSRGIASFSWSFDGERAASNVVVLGDGDGPDREEGGATDNTVFGGVILEDVLGPFTGAPIDTLDERATAYLAALKQPEVLEVTTAPYFDDYLYGTLVVGDTVPVFIDRGFVQVDGDYRVIGMQPLAGGGMTLELNSGASVVLRRPDPMTEIKRLERQVRELRRKVTPQEQDAEERSFPLGVGGTVIVTTTPPEYPPFTATVVGVRVSLGTAGTTTTTARILKNGTAVTDSSVSLTSGETDSGRLYFPMGWVKNTDYLELEVTAAGTGAANLNYALYYRRA